MDLDDPTHLLNTYVVHEIPPLAHYITNFITKAEEEEIIKKVYSAPQPKWTQLKNRRLQNWGGIPHENGMIAEEIPKWLEDQIDRIVAFNVFDENKRPNHVLINEYSPGQGIMPHTDGPLFHPIVTTISCGSHTILKFYKRYDTQEVIKKKVIPKCEFSFLLEPRSLLILREYLYHNYLHTIEEKSADVISQKETKNLSLCSDVFLDDNILKRSKRISLTIRHVPKTTKIKLRFGK